MRDESMPTDPNRPPEANPAPEPVTPGAANHETRRRDSMAVLGLDDCVSMLERLFDMSITIARQREEICTRIADWLKTDETVSVDQTLRIIKNRLSSSEAVRVYRHLKPDVSTAEARKFVEEL